MHDQNVRMEQLAASCHLANMDAVHFQMYVKNIFELYSPVAVWVLNASITFFQ